MAKTRHFQPKSNRKRKSDFGQVTPSHGPHQRCVPNKTSITLLFSLFYGACYLCLKHAILSIFFQQRNKEVIVYPDDSNKPPLGDGLNKRAQVTLDKVWPMDKTKKEPIVSPGKLADLNYEDKLQRACNKLGAKFVEYRPETGSWVFKVEHFSKYGLDDDSDEENVVTAAKDLSNKKLKTSLAPQTTAGEFLSNEGL